MYRGPAKSFSIIVGTNKLNSGGTKYQVVDTLLHPKYDQEHSPFDYDISLFYLESDIEFNEKVQPIKYGDQFIGDDIPLLIKGRGKYHRVSWMF